MKRVLVQMAFVLACSALGLLQASSFYSKAGLASCTWDGGPTALNVDSSATTCTAYATPTVLITPHTAWQANFTDAKWISYRDTGTTGATYEPFKGSTPVFSVTESFVASAGTLLKFSVWADDTAGVWLDGVQLKAPNLTQSTCANGPIGCESGEGGHFSLNLATDGPHTLEFRVYQVGTGKSSDSNPMGLLYKGTVPDGGMTLMLLGGALVGLETLRRKCRS